MNRLPDVIHIRKEKLPRPLFYLSNSVRGTRRGRVTAEIIAGLFLGAAAAGATVGSWKTARFSLLAFLASWTGRTKMARKVQARHQLEIPVENIPPSMRQMARLLRSHPIFSFEKNGDMVLHRPTEREKKLLARQEKLFARMGLNWWRWRGKAEFVARKRGKPTPPREPAPVSAVISPKPRALSARAKARVPERLTVVNHRPRKRI